MGREGTLARLAYPVELLFIVLRDLTIPMVEEEKYSRPVCALSLGGAAQFVTFVVVGRGKWLGLDDEDRNSTLVGGVMPISVVVLLASLLPVALLYWRLDPKAPPTGGLATALLVVGFASSILWTNELADELVAALQYLGTALGVSPSILGLTVLAWGNSLGDLIADTALARAGNPRMGAASCFGSPLFNMMIGAGSRSCTRRRRTGRSACRRTRWCRSPSSRSWRRRARRRRCRRWASSSRRRTARC